MPSQNLPLTSFSGGEIGDRANARVDLKVYQNTAKIMENVFPLVQGGMIKAPGSEFIGETVDDGVAILRSFIYDVDQTAVLEFSDQRLRFVIDSGFLAAGAADASFGAYADESGSGSSISVGGGGVATLISVTDVAAQARSTVTTISPNAPVTIQFSTLWRDVTFWVGTSANGQEVVEKIVLKPGLHVQTFTPGATTYYINVSMNATGQALLYPLIRIAGGDLQLQTPFLAADLPSLRHEQSADFVWLYLRRVQTRVLERHGAQSWSLRLYGPPDGPFEKVNTQPITLAPSASTGTISITASDDLFDPGSVGQLVQITQTGQFAQIAITDGTQVSDPILVTGVGTERQFQLSITGTFSGTVKLRRSYGDTSNWQDYLSWSSDVAPVIDDKLDNQTIYYRIEADPSGWTGTATASMSYTAGTTTGIALITAYSSKTLVDAEVFATFATTDATRNWAVGSWSDDLGWATAGTLYDGRHWLGRDDRLWGSVSDEYESQAIGSLDASALSRFLATGEVNAVRWLQAGAQLLVGTSGAEVVSRSSSLDEPITPTNQVIRVVSTKGTMNTQALKIDLDVVFASRSTQRLYRMKYGFNATYVPTYSADDLTRLNKDIASENGFVELAIQREPEPRIWALRADGQAGVLLYLPDEEITGWSRINDPGAFYESVCVLPGAPEDRVYFVVRRVINGVTVRYIERLALEGWTDLTQAWRLRCAAQKTAAPFTSITGLTWLEGETVSVWADARRQVDKIVSGGAITLDYAVSTAIVGLNYTGTYQPSRFSVQTQKGTVLTQEQSIARLGMVIDHTPAGAFAFAADGNPLQRLNDNAGGDAMDSPVEVLSKDFAEDLGGETRLDPTFTIIMDQPAPVCILALVPHVRTDER